MEKAKFDQVLEDFCSDDEGKYENAYLLLLENIGPYRQQVVDAMQSAEDPVLRGKFLEVLGETKDTGLIPVFKHELQHSHEEVRMWAYFQLSRLNSEEARDLVENYRDSHPDEDWVNLLF